MRGGTATPICERPSRDPVATARPVTMYSALVPHVRRLLQEHDASITFVDVGARNGSLELAAICDVVDAYGFEPNPDEYEKLLSGKTDASRIGAVAPPFRSLRYLPYAVSDTNGTAQFHV